MIYQSNIIDIVKVKNGAPGAAGTPGKTLYTWIAYANAEGIDSSGQLINPADFDTEDSSNRAFIGIATNKETSTESTQPADYKWSKIQGEQGPVGQEYFLEINTSEIKRFWEDDNTVTFSPDFIYFYAYDSGNNDVQFKNALDQKTEFDVKVEVLQNLSGSGRYELTNLDYSSVSGSADEKKYWNFSISERITDFEFLKSEDSFLLFSLLKSTKVVATQVVPVGWALSSEYAKFWLTAKTIQASVDGAGLKFGSDGLTISNSTQGGIKIIHRTDYIKSEDTEIIAGKRYFIEENGVYTEVISPSGNPSQNNYYELSKDSGEVVFNADTAGNVSITGNIVATSGKIGDIDIVNGGLSYRIDGEQEPIFSLNKDGLVANAGSLGNLDLTGNLTLTTGKIIGGTIDPVTGDGNGFVINGENGSIIANNIALGSAKLSDYLELGDCWIFNPEAFYTVDDDLKTRSNWFENSFINVNYRDEGGGLHTAVSITSDGYMKLKSDEQSSAVILDGKEGVIYSSGSSGYWRIDANSAIFNNITARGSLKCAVLEYGEVQSVGGMLLIRPSSIIKSWESISQEEIGGKYKNTLRLFLENASQLQNGDYCQIQISNNETIIGQISAENTSNNSVEFIFEKVEKSIPDLVGASIISFGRREGATASEEDVSSYGIGLNASDNDSLLPKRALSLLNFYYDKEQNSFNSDERIILGYIPNIPDKFGSIANNYGLYAENVLVKGKLISGVVNSGYFSGIDSLSKIEAPGISNFNTGNLGNIVFWAGANKADTATSDAAAVQNSPFWVDTLGNMYASSGYFEGAIISHSTIEASEIRTAIITGIGNEDFALKIRDTNENNTKAIRFYSSSGDTEKNYFSLTNTKLTLDEQVDILINYSTPAGGVSENKIKIGHEAIVSPNFSTSNYGEDTDKITADRALMNKSFIGFKRGSGSNDIGFKIDDNGVLSINNISSCITVSDNLVSTIKAFSIGAEFNLWDKIEIKRIIKSGSQNQEVIGFDIDFMD